MVFEGENVFCCTKEVIKKTLIFLDVDNLSERNERNVYKEFFGAQFLSFNEISIVNVAFIFDSRYEIFFGKRN